jgi:hypothetical protein
MPIICQTSEIMKDNKIQKVMHEFKKNKLKSSSGKKVKSRSQALAIALSEQAKNNKKS